MRKQPAPLDRFILPSGRLVQVDRLLKTEGVVCHFIHPDGRPTHITQNGSVTFLQTWLAKFGKPYRPL